MARARCASRSSGVARTRPPGPPRTPADGGIVSRRAGKLSLLVLSGDRTLVSTEIDPLYNEDVRRALAFARARERFPGLDGELLRGWCEAGWRAAVAAEADDRGVVERFDAAASSGCRVRSPARAGRTRRRGPAPDPGRSTPAEPRARARS